MNDAKRIKTAMRVVAEQLQALNELVKKSVEEKDHQSGFERLHRWKVRTIELLSKHVHPNEGNRLAEKRKSSFSLGNPLRNLVDEADMYNGFLIALGENLTDDPAHILDAPMPSANPPAAPTVENADSNVIFIIHGHDELNLLRLKEIVRDRWKLDPVVLAKQAGKGRTLIEKFEDEAKRACFALALLTPDDIVTCENSEYAQARPNVIFELGWFYGRLRRDRVAIVFKKGTKIHSDLDGISRIEFNDSVDEVVPEIERELLEIGVLEK